MSYIFMQKNKNAAEIKYIHSESYHYLLQYFCIFPQRQSIVYIK
jgi:hypothetical protein